jgi:hypothetical protein
MYPKVKLKILIYSYEYSIVNDILCIFNILIFQYYFIAFPKVFYIIIVQELKDLQSIVELSLAYL